MGGLGGGAGGVCVWWGGVGVQFFPFRVDPFFGRGQTLI